MSPAPLHMECSLDKEMYYHGENIVVNVLVNNNSNKTVKKIKITVRQYAEICLFSTAQYKCPVAELEAEDGFPLGPSTQMSKVRLCVCVCECVCARAHRDQTMLFFLKIFFAIFFLGMALG